MTREHLPGTLWAAIENMSVTRRLNSMVVRLGRYGGPSG